MATTTEMPPPPPASTLHLPRILCLHGGGTNARIFHMQCRAISHNLLPHARLVFAEAPHPSAAGPDVLSVYADCGPFKRWVLTAAPNALEQQPRETWAGIDGAIAAAMEGDEGDGEWIGVLGFSQGAKVAASLLLRQQQQQQGQGQLGYGFQFGVLMAGRGPLLPPAAEPEAEEWLREGERFDYAANARAGRVVRMPTLHVHGMQDPGLGYHQILLEEWCDPATAVLLEWEGNHRLPIKTADVTMVCGKIREFMAKAKKI